MKFTMSGLIHLDPDNPENPDAWFPMDATWENGEVTGEAAFLIKVRALQLMGTRIGTHPATMIDHLVSPHSVIFIAKQVFRDLKITGDPIPPIIPEDPGRFLRLKLKNQGDQ